MNGGGTVKKSQQAANFGLVWFLARGQCRVMNSRMAARRYPKTAICTALSLLILIGLQPVLHAADLKSLLSGKTLPLSVKLGEMGGDWRRVTIHSSGSVSGNISVSVSGNGSSGSSQNNVSDLAGSKTYLTKGQTVSADGQTYLVAYHLPNGGLDLSALIESMATKTPPAVSVLTPQTTLPLSLLDLKSVGTLDDIRAFDLNEEIAQSEKLVRTMTSIMKAASNPDSNSGAASQGKASK